MADQHAENIKAVKALPLAALHHSLGGKMVPFAGYEMAVQYPLGVKGEHLHVREKAGLFDVSHMGQAWLCLKEGIGEEDAHRRLAAALETLVPGEIQKLGKGRLRYTVLLADDGGILDDLMVTRPITEQEAGRLFLVVNAAVKEQDFAYIHRQLSDIAELSILDDQCLLALQGPSAHQVVEALFPETVSMPFMSMMHAEYQGVPVMISRCGYTGEDGYEFSLSRDAAESFAKTLLAHPDVAPIGLGARDSLRLEAGLCLYGHDMTPTETPVEAGLSFAIGKRRRQEGGFLGYDRIQKQIEQGPQKIRVGIKPEGRAPAREGVEIADEDGTIVGVVTSGGFGPTVEGPIAMGYVPASLSEPGTPIQLLVRGKLQPARIVSMPFVEQRYFRGSVKNK